MLPTGTVTFLFTDIQGSTPLWEREPEKMAEALQTHNGALHQAIDTHGGVVFKTVGDEFQAAFPTAQQALSAAIAGQRNLSEANWNELGELKVRMGLHTGEAELDPNGDEYAVSHTKNRAARIMSVGHGGQILLSQETTNLLQSLPQNVFLKDLGEHRLKGLEFLEHISQAYTLGLSQEFPPLSTSIRHPHNLPLLLTNFIGREQEISEVVELIDKNRLVTLTGPGGTGKTRLSLRVAEEMLVRFPKGVWFVELAELGDPELLPRQIAAALGLVENPLRSLTDQLKDYLHKKQLLIILDNCEHVITDCARISDDLLQDCPELKILASSREILRVTGEIVYQVPSLSVPESLELPPLDKVSEFSALRLFTERAEAVNPGFAVTTDNARAIIQICRRLDGIPLAIELAAARMSVLSVEQIATRLADRLRLLTTGSRTAALRQQTLQASIDWSYSLLEELERLLLMRLSVFHGGWTLELASEVCGSDGLDEFDVLEGLSQLVNKSLIQAVKGVDGSRRYRQLETIRQFSHQKLLDWGASEVMHERHLDAFLHLVETAEPHLRGHYQVEWLDRLEIELDNLRAALEWALAQDAQKGLHLATAMFWFWHNRGFRVEGESWLRLLLERWGKVAEIDLVLLATAQVRLAHLQMSVGWLGKQITQTAEEALALADQLGNDGNPIRAMALWVLAISAKHLGQYATAHRYGRQCLEITIAIKDRFLIAEANETLIDCEPDPINARHFAEKHLALRRELGDLDGQIIAYIYKAIIEFWSGDQGQARQLCKAAMEIARIVKNRWGLIEGHSILGYICRASGEMDKAIAHFQRALVIVQDTGEQGRIVRQLNALGCAYSSKRDWPVAEGYFQQAIDTARIGHLVHWEIISCINLAEVAGTFGEMVMAEAHYQAAAGVDHSQEDTFINVLVAYGSGKAKLLRGDVSIANESFQQVLKDAVETGNRRIMKYSMQALAVCAIQSGQLERAIRLRGLITSRGWLLWPMEMPWLVPYDLDGLLVPTRDTLGEDEYARLTAESQVMTLEQAVTYALGVQNE